MTLIARVQVPAPRVLRVIYHAFLGPAPPQTLRATHRPHSDPNPSCRPLCDPHSLSPPMDKLSAADVLVELEALFNLHPSGAFPALALLYNGLRGQAAPGDPGMAENRLPQVCQCPLIP